MQKMLADYFRSFWRGVLHNKMATLINVGGLALGFTVFFALSFYVDREFSWDAHWEDADRIYVASSVVESAGGSAPSLFDSGPYVLGTSLQTRYPDAFEVFARVYSRTDTAVVDDEEYTFSYRYHAEPALLDLLQFETVEGSLQEVFADPRSIAISTQQAERLFAGVSPLGRTVSFKPMEGRPTDETPVDFVIKAVFNLREPTTFVLHFLALLEPTAPPQSNARLDLWQAVPPSVPQPGQPPPILEQPLYVAHYFKLREGMDAKALERDMRAFLDENRFMNSGLSTTRFVFRNIKDRHLRPSLFEIGDRVQRLWVYAAIGVLVLAISGCNFVMLATLRLVDRMREVGIRKSVGGGVGPLMGQYLLDAFLHTFIAMLIGVAFLALAFPKLAPLLQLPPQLDLLTPRNLGLCFLMVVVFTLVSSLYPAWMSSQSKPGPLLRSGSGAVVGTGTGLRKLLVGIQFAIVVVLLLATAVTQQQIEYTRTRPPGYSLDNLVQLRVELPEMQQLPALIAEFNAVPGVEITAMGGVGPGAIMLVPPTLVRTIAADGSVHEAGLQQSSASPGFFRLMSTRVLAGREFSAELDAPPPSPSGAPASGTPTPGIESAAPARESRVILNESAARLLGFAEPAMAIEQLLERDTSTPDGQVRKQSMRVVGVVEDMQLASVMLPAPANFYNYAERSNFVGVKLVQGVDVDAVTEDLRAAWSRVVPGAAFQARDGTASANFQLRREEFEARIIIGSTALAVLIALLGLYSLVAATVLKRVKEIGVRKVMGAGRRSIVTLFVWQFSKPVVVANLLAWPLGFWGITQWLQRFPYQLDTAVIVVSGAVASIVALLVAWITVGVMAARAASVKPVLALRYE
jgi:putative ABC transport system permease protein